MSIKSMTWAFEQPLSGHAKVVLLVLADFANDDGDCWPSVPVIAKKAYVSERSVQRYIAQLVDQGYMRIEARTAKGGGKTSNRYFLNVKEAGQRGGDNLTPPLVTEMSPPGDSANTTPGDTVVTCNEPSSLTVRKKEGLTSFPKKPERGSRLPEDFCPDKDATALAEKLEIAPKEAQEQLDAFRDYWHSAPGQKGRKLDWQATFRNWLRNFASRRRQAPKGSGKRSNLETILSCNDSGSEMGANPQRPAPYRPQPRPEPDLGSSIMAEVEKQPRKPIKHCNYPALLKAFERDDATTRAILRMTAQQEEAAAKALAISGVDAAKAIIFAGCEATT